MKHRNTFLYIIDVCFAENTSSHKLVWSIYVKIRVRDNRDKTFHRSHAIYHRFSRGWENVGFSKILVRQIFFFFFFYLILKKGGIQSSIMNACIQGKIFPNLFFNIQGVGCGGGGGNNNAHTSHRRKSPDIYILFALGINRPWSL